MPQFLAGLAFGLVLLLILSLQNGGDPAALIAAGEANTFATPHLIETMGREIPLRPAGGHDGQAYYLQALDPLFIGTTEHILFTDRPIYRAQRMLFPFVTGLGGLAPAPWIPWLMGLISACSFGVATAAVGELALRRRLSPWLGLSVPLNLGLLMEFGIGGAQIMAFALALVGVVLMERNRLWPAGLVFAASALTRETMVIFIGGAVLYWMFEHRRLPFHLVLPSAMAGLGWAGYLRWRIDELPGTKGIAEIALPFRGITQAASGWGGEQIGVLGFSALLIVVAVLAAVRMPSPLTFGGVFYLPFAAIVGRVVWVEWYDITRILHPIFTAAVFFMLSRSELLHPASTPAVISQESKDTTSPVSAG